MISLLLFIVYKKKNAANEFICLIDYSGGPYTVNRLQIRLIAGVWSLAAFVFVQAYTSTLITYVLAPNNFPLVSSFSELADRPDVSLLVKKLGTVDDLLLVREILFNLSLYSLVKNLIY